MRIWINWGNQRQDAKSALHGHCFLFWRGLGLTMNGGRHQAKDADAGGLTIPLELLVQSDEDHGIGSARDAVWFFVALSSKMRFHLVRATRVYELALMTEIIALVVPG